MRTVHRHKLAGFTLIEILGTVVILGIAAGIMLPQIRNRDDLKTSSTARELTADLLYAQNRAIATGKTHYVVFDSVNNKYDLLDAISPQNIITHPVLGTPYEVLLGGGAMNGLRASTVSFDGQSTIAFDSLGTPYAYTTATQTLSPLSNGSIVLTSGGASTTVSVQPFSGEIKVQ